MKWTNPGHQLDELGAQYLKVENLYIFGTDDKAKQAYDFLCWLGVAEDFNISFVLDITVFNSINQRDFCGKRLIAFQTDLCSEVQASPETSAVALPWIAQTAERAILEQMGVSNIFYLLHSHNRRDNFIQNFVCIWLMYKRGKLLSHSTNFLVTARCNLNCKYCLNFNEFLENPQDIAFEDFKENIDVLFSKFDYLFSFHLCGGDPLMARELPRMIRYIEENYRGRIFDFFLITNGTLIPNEETIAAVRSLDGHFLIDDYSATVSKTRLEEITDKLKSHGVGYSINKVDHWFDLDVDHTDYTALPEDALERHKDGCNSFLQEIGEKRIYACCYQQYAHRAGKGPLEEGDYIEIASASKMEILEFRQGYTCRGYTSLCKTCRGIGDDTRKVPAAVQIPKRTASGAGQGVRPDSKADAGALVSICVPVYNTGKYLMRCVDSLIHQSYHNLEIILVDDGSTDGSGLICGEYAAADNRVSVIHKPNGGEASARNAGLRSAKGEYVMFIDSDDEYLPDAVERMISAVKHEGIDLVIGGYLERRGKVEHFGTGHQRIQSSAEIARDYLTSGCPYGIPYIATTVNAKLFRRELIKNHSLSFDERFVIGNDALFICNYLKHVQNIYDLFTPIYIYYKFQPTERIQGMGWFYPDAFFLFAYIADRMIKIADLDEAERRQMLSKHYKDLLYALTNATLHTQYFENGLMPYLTSFCDEIDLLQDAARLDLAENYIRKEDGALPIRLLSYLIVNRRYDDLYDLLHILAKARKMLPYQGEYVRQMIRLQPETGEKDTAKADGAPVARSFIEDSLLLEQVNELIMTITAAEKQAETYQAQAEDAEARARASMVQAEDAEARARASRTQAEDAEARAKTSAAQAEDAEARARASAAQAEDAEARARASRTQAEDAEARAKTSAAQAEDAEARARASRTQAEDAEARARASRTQAEDAEARARASRTQAEDAEARARASRTQAEDAEARARASAAQAEDAEFRMHQITNSRSWRLTKPLRVSMDFLRRR